MINLNEIKPEQVFVINVGSAANITKAKKFDSSYLINCVVHKVQLGVAQFLWKDEKSTTELINEAGHIVVKLRTPTVYYKLTNENQKQPKLQVETRWNSVFEMLKRLLELKDFCTSSQNIPGYDKLRMSEEKWIKIEELIKVLDKHLLKPSFCSSA